MTDPSGLPQVVHRPSAIMTGDEARAYAKELADSTMVSPYFRGSVPNMLYAIELGQNYGLKPTSILQHIHVFETTVEDKKTKRVDTVLKAGLSSALMVYLARTAGHIVNTSASPSFGKTTIVRGDSIFGKMLKGTVDPSELEHYSNILNTLKEMGVDPKATAFTESVWNLEKAQTAGLLDARGQGKGNWKTYPHAMLAAHSKTDAVRLACEEVLIQISDTAANIGQLSYEGVPIDVQWKHTADELGAEITDDGELVPSSNAPRTAVAPRPQHQQSAPEPEPVRERIVVTPSAADAARDIAAQAASDPSKAGWHGGTQRAETKTAGGSRIQQFVNAKSGEDLATWAKMKIISNESDEVKATQVAQVMGILVEDSPSSKVIDCVRAICEMTDLDAGQKVELVAAIHKAVTQFQRVDAPVTYTAPGTEGSTSSGLGEAVMAFAAPLVKVLKVG